jgi:hypothetical protein
LKDARAHRLLSRFFTVEEINGGERCPTYMYRWTILSTRWFKIYVHQFVADDWSTDLHDHPKRFISIGLSGEYLEETPHEWAGFKRYVLFKAPWIRTFPATHVHRLTGPTPEHPCWTLVIVGQPTREWGFWPLATFVPWRKYIGSERADQAKACD